MGQRQFASRWYGFEIDTDARHLGRELRHTEGEDKPARAVDLKVGADMLDILAVAASNVEGAANAGVDLHAHHLSRRRGEKKLTGLGRIDPGVENALDREIEAARDDNRSRILGRHFGFPFLSGCWAAAASSALSISSSASSRADKQ